MTPWVHVRRHIHDNEYQNSLIELLIEMFLSGGGLKGISSMEKRYMIKIKIGKTLLMFAKSEEEARGKIQDYLDGNIDSVETVSIEEVKSFYL